MLLHTLEVLGRVRRLERTLVISRDPAALSIAHEHGAYTVAESGRPELNVALRQATDVAHAFGAQAVLVLPTDLPLITGADVRAMLEAGIGPEPNVVVAPDRHSEGTNALLIRPPGLLQYQFGARSLQAHVAQAQRLAVPLQLCLRPGLQLDIDVPDDLTLLRRLNNRAPAAGGGRWSPVGDGAGQIGV